jgi:hypothetical protein
VDEDVEPDAAVAEPREDQPREDQPREDQPHEDHGDQPLDDDHEDHPPGDQPRPGQARLPQKRKRCSACYRQVCDAEGRRRGQAVKRVPTSCVRCGKPFCLNHMRLYCGACDVARLPLQELADERARNERERQEFQTTVDRQRQQIDELQQQVRVLVPLVS